MTGERLILVLGLIVLTSAQLVAHQSTSISTSFLSKPPEHGNPAHWAPTTPAAAAAAGRARPPRGFCVRISRAIKPTSLCHKHLVVLGTGTAEVGEVAHNEHRQATSETRPTKDGQEQSGSQGQVTTTQADEQSQATNRQHRARRFVAHRRHQEELVYVRSETLGDEITNLSTQVINERLVAALLNQLIPSGGGGGGAEADQTTAPTSEEANSASHNANQMLKSEIRQQIAGSSSPEANELLRAKKCQLGVERLVCRLVYPTCHFRSMDAGALVRPPCREDCLLLRDELCPNLNWSKFTRALQQAINSTLMATINALDLLVDGDPPAAMATAAPQPALASSNTSARHGNNATTAADAKFQVGNTGENHRNQAKIELTTSRRLRRRRFAPTYTWPSGYNLSSSLHFYWPHEHSIDRCEMLPPLRPLVPHMDHADLGLARISRDAAMSAASTRWIFDHRRNSAICSNAHLTEVSLDETQERLTNINLVPDNDRRRPAGRTTTNSADTTKECLRTSNGVDYKGTKNVTRSGLVCQFWRDQYPHRHKSSELLFDIMKDSHNYCRNPGGLDSNGPFCYTMDKNVRWEYCQIERCKNQ